MYKKKEQILLINRSIKSNERLKRPIIFLARSFIAYICTVPNFIFKTKIL